MGSEGGPPSVTVHVTGFKKFLGVAENPTEKIVSNLKQFVQKRGLASQLTLGSCTVLETAGDGALLKLYQTLESAMPEPFKHCSGHDQIIWLHFGVNSGSKKFAIERQAVNEATFRCPDELGWQPQKVHVVPDDGVICRTRETTCSYQKIAKFVREKGFDVAISDDAGRFVCNYVYYHSLRFAEQKGHKALFIHVPLFSCIDEDTQMQFAATLLDALVLHH